MRRGVLSIFARAKNASARASAPWRSRVSSGGYFLSAYAPAAVVSLNTRLLPPLRTSSIAVIATGGAAVNGSGEPSNLQSKLRVRQAGSPTRRRDGISGTLPGDPEDPVRRPFAHRNPNRARCEICFRPVPLCPTAGGKRYPARHL